MRPQNFNPHLIFLDNLNIRVHRDMATGKRLPEKVVENLAKADRIGDEMYLSYKRKSWPF